MTDSVSEQEEPVTERQPADEQPSGTPTINLGRIAWALTALGFLTAAIILLLGRRYGYAEVTFAVAIAAGINLL